eukprot:CAMPEP_0176238178 /NCGR_PEP_ID=MMETSP0121_2-20121125/28231_1 /TAXON_ID=160619 /ORGANISM="Kryptoperidinium foliaceum, Strain CCMP 1326" /LENGTH=235 /DNA_ID=CAMNT_0017577645 /DNA_START=19 /DNA_END=724 /DNA_ORIENTATION=-
MDGANIEIREEGGEDTMFIFGCLEDEVPKIKERASQGNYPIDPRMQKVFDTIKSGRFACGDSEAQEKFCGLIDKLCNITAAGTWDGDKYLLINDFASYIAAQELVDKTYADQARWASLSIQAACSMAKFSTDRTISEYAKVIWGVEPSPRPAPQAEAKKRGGTAPTAAAAICALSAQAKVVAGIAASRRSMREPRRLLAPAPARARFPPPPLLGHRFDLWASRAAARSVERRDGT